MGPVACSHFVKFGGGGGRCGGVAFGGWVLLGGLPAVRCLMSRGGCGSGLEGRRRYGCDVGDGLDIGLSLGNVSVSADVQVRGICQPRIRHLENPTTECLGVVVWESRLRYGGSASCLIPCIRYNS